MRLLVGDQVVRSFDPADPPGSWWSGGWARVRELGRANDSGFEAASDNGYSAWLWQRPTQGEPFGPNGGRVFSATDARLVTPSIDLRSAVGQTAQLSFEHALRTDGG